MEAVSPPAMNFSKSAPIIKSRSGARGKQEKGEGRTTTIASRRQKVGISQLDTVELPGLQPASPGGEIGSPFARFPSATVGSPAIIGRPRTSDRMQLSVRISPKVSSTIDKK
jgi:hypothetical protein